MVICTGWCGSTEKEAINLALVGRGDHRMFPGGSECEGWGGVSQTKTVGKGFVGCRNSTAKAWRWLHCGSGNHVGSGISEVRKVT